MTQCIRKTEKKETTDKGEEKKEQHCHYSTKTISFSRATPQNCGGRSSSKRKYRSHPLAPLPITTEGIIRSKRKDAQEEKMLAQEKIMCFPFSVTTVSLFRSFPASFVGEEDRPPVVLTVKSVMRDVCP
ncbi:hypothetical protein NPIL_667931 [Nephila pilipes]|uniref:Uncharacterized protein n=1 Tax=Nephila pilipes TaxID=299642 RepID=A0A8X6NBL8_NEPPI|nr:hypothetical protein NPIL_667931 [Nephila pilipes]